MAIPISLSLFLNSAYSDAKINHKYAKTEVNVRDSPSMKGNIVGKINWNEKIKILRKLKKWYVISYKKKKRYVYKKYFKKKKSRHQTYHLSSKNKFKSYEDANCITDNQNIPQGKFKKKYYLDYQSGIWMADGRYCIAIGSYYTNKIGVKVDLVLSHNGRKHALKCITADCKADRDTINKHRTHKDGSVVEFIVNTSILSRKVKLTGDVSYAGGKFIGKVVAIKVYK